MTDSVRKQMWKAMEESPFLMLKLNESGDHAVPMEAHLDSHAHGEFWFYTSRTNRLAPGGKAMAQFISKDHDLFCCISGTLVEERDPAVIDRYWSNTVAAWYDKGRDDPALLMLRFELDDAEIWTLDRSLKGMFKLLTGKRAHDDEMGVHTTVDLHATH